MSSVLLVVTFASLAALGDPSGVVIGEIHYRPPASLSGPGSDSGQDKGVEFVELYNSTNAAVDLGGWELAGAVRFAFPDGVSLAAGERVVVCRRRVRFLEVFAAVDASAVFGDFDGTLANDVDTVTLRDDARAFVDAVRYEDCAPWPEEAGGGGASLQRVCASASGEESANWSASAPTPLAANPAAACPLPPFTMPRVTIHEINYHPQRPNRILGVGEDGEDTEFVELHNTSGVAVNLRGWRFSDGIDFAFSIEHDTVLPAGGYLSVARNEGAVREAFDVLSVLGNYDGRLANGGERVTLVDELGQLVDSVFYDDTDPWPYAADGRGRTLERVSAAVSSERAANWRASRVSSDGFQRLTFFGSLRGRPTERFVVSSYGVGEFIIDNVRVESLAEPGANLVSNSTFDTGIGNWSLNGAASGSVWLADGGVGGGGALKLISNGQCPFDTCGTAHAVVFTLPAGLDLNSTYRFSLDVRYVSGEVAPFVAGIFGGTTGGLDHIGSPGASSTVAGTPLLVSDIGRFPEEPTSTDMTWITARVQYGGAGSVEVELIHNDGAVGVEPGTVVPMLDDGMSRDGLPADGVYGAVLPPQAHNTQLRYRIEARAGGGKVLSPRPFQPSMPSAEEVWGYYVNDLQVESDLPVYHILLNGIDGGDKDAVNNLLRCTILTPASFACRGELYPDVQARFRGNTMCVVDKRNFKVRFNDGRLFTGNGAAGLRKLNFNSMWTDKALVREHMAWRLIDELGLPYSATEYVRLNVSGSYYGLYLCLEHPDERFLKRNELDPDGNLYKAEQPAGADPSPKGVSLPSAMLGETYADLWQEETNEGGDFSDLAMFVEDMHADGLDAEGPSVGFWDSRADPELLIQYQVGQVALNNIDSFAKNHFLFNDLSAGRWGMLTWDLDLCFGKFFSQCAVAPEAGRRVGTLNDILLCNPQPERSAECLQLPPQLDPWFASTVNENILRNWVVEFFFNAGSGYYQRAYLKRLWDVMSDKVRNEVYDSQLDALVARLAVEAEEDFLRWGRFPTNVPGTPDGMLAHVELVKGQIACHGEFIRAYIEEFHPEITQLPEVKFTEILYSPIDGDSDLEFVELKNLSAAAVDLSGWTLAGGIRYTFPNGTVVASGEPLIVAKNPAALLQQLTQRVFGPFSGRLNSSGEALWLRDSGSGYPATVDFLHYRDDGEWPEVRPGESIELTAVSRGRDNDVGRNWRSSASTGGTPGRSDGVFSRGDANSDDRFDLTDALFIVNWLFLAGPTPGCIDSADVDDSARVDVTDAVVLLNFLFLSGPMPAAPFPNVGEDETLDELTCLNPDRS
jgi:hypothetical protein